MPNNKTIFSKVIAIAMFLALLLTGTTEIFSQVTTPFQPRFQSNEKGDIQIFGNALLKCPAGNCGGNNNSYSMVNIDIDSDASTFNSSSANFTLPAGATVLWAGLYWNGISTNSARNTALFKTPASGGYVSLTGITYDNSYGYQGFKDVTSLVQAGGTGTYMTANVRTNTGTNTWAGWALVVVYRDPSKPQRNLTVFDGLANVSTSNANVNITISGFTTPLFGPVNVALGVVAYDGDADLTGDALKFNNQVIVGTSPGYLYKNDSPLTSVQTENNGIPAKFELNQNFPNPFNPSTQISFAVPQKSFVSLKIYDVQGSEVATLVNEDKEPGFYSINFDAKKLSSGVHFYKVIAGDFNAVRKMILLK